MFKREHQSNVDKLIHSNQENLRPPQRSAVLFTVYAFKSLILLHGRGNTHKHNSFWKYVECHNSNTKDN